MQAVYGFTLETGASCLWELEPNKERRYILSRPVEAYVRTDAGVLHAKTAPSFVFDGRSGPRCIDWYVPNLGSLEERVAFWLHDCLAYAGSLDFKETNLLLKYFLRDMCGYRKRKAEIIRLAVSIDKSWYGEPKPGDEWYCNRHKVWTDFTPVMA